MSPSEQFGFGDTKTAFPGPDVLDKNFRLQAYACTAHSTQTPGCRPIGVTGPREIQQESPVLGVTARQRFPQMPQVSPAYKAAEQAL